MYTKTGFKVPFGCCSHWNRCNEGHECIYKESDPEAMEGCQLYQRKDTVKQHEPVILLEEKRLDAGEQLSLF